MSFPIISVAHNHVAIIERLSRYNRTLKEGVHLLTPCIDSVHYVDWSYKNAVYNQNFKGWLIPLSEQCYDPKPVTVTTNDGVDVQVDLVVYFTIVNPTKAVYGTPNLFRGIENLLETALAAAVRQIDSGTLDANLIDRHMRSSDVKFEENLDDWGVKMRIVRVQRVVPPERIRTATVELVAMKRSALVNITKLEEEFDRKTKLARHTEIERKSQHALEQLENNHRREQEQKEQESISIKMRVESDAAAYARIKEAESRATARKIEAENEREITENEIQVLKNVPESILEFLTLRNRFSAISTMNKSASTTLIVGPEQILEGASRAPFFNATGGNRSQTK